MIKSLEYSGILLKEVGETIENEAKEQKGGFLSMLRDTLGASLLGDLLTKNVSGKEVIRAGEGIVRAGYGSKRYSLKKFLIPPHPLTYFEIEAYYQNEPRFIGVYSRDNLPDKIKHGPYVVNLVKYSDIGTHWGALHVNNETATYFDSFGVEHIPKETKRFINNKNIVANIYRVQNYDSIMWSYFYIGFINYMLEGKNSTDFTNLFLPNNFKKNDDIILNCFLNKL